MVWSCRKHVRYTKRVPQPLNNLQEKALEWLKSRWKHYVKIYERKINCEDQIWIEHTQTERHIEQRSQVLFGS
jgi:hypothetical protein